MTATAAEHGGPDGRASGGASDASRPPGTGDPARRVDGPADPAAADNATAERGELVGRGSREEVIRGYQRSARDALRVIGFLLLSALIMILTIAAEDAIVGMDEDVVRLFEFLTPSLERIVRGLAVLASVTVGLAALIVPLAVRRYRLFGYILAAGVLGALLMHLANVLVGRDEPRALLDELASRDGFRDAALSSSVMFAATVSAMVALGPFVAASWRRTGAITIGALVLVRIVVSTQLPAEVLLALPIGAACGVSVLLAFGRPDRHPTRRAMAAALTGAGLRATSIAPARADESERRADHWVAELPDGGELFVKVLGDDQRVADLLYRSYRFLRLKNVGDERPFSSLRRAVEHEALVSLAARDVGARAPRMRAVMQVGADSMLIAHDRLPGTSLDHLPDDTVTDELMREVWRQVATLSRSGIAHRDLKRSNILVDDDGVPWLIDFGFAEIGVSESMLGADVAQLLVTFALIAGPERSVDAALAVIGPDAVAGSLPRLQPRALPGATQREVRHRKELLPLLREEVLRRCDAAPVDLAELERINAKTLLMGAVLVGAVYFLLPQLADLPNIITQIRDVDWAWVPAVVGVGLLTFVGATAAIAGAIPARLAVGPLAVAQVAASFVSKIAPAGLGGMALNVRFLQRQGVDRAVAVSGVGLSTVMGFAAHISLMVVFLLWAGRGAFDSIELPRAQWFLIGLAAVAALGAVVVAMPFSRRFLLRTVMPVLRRSADGVSTVLRQPLKLALLFGGSLVITGSNLLSLFFATRAFGGELTLAAVGAVFLVGAAVANVAPTPGGLGAMEAALIAGLVAAGMPNTIAVPAVFLFRFATFWLPILPGWACFTWLNRREYV